MKNNNLIQEEINRATQLWGYDTSKTLFEQATGNTGTTLMGVTLNTCTGGTTPWLAQYAITINGNNPTQADIGKTIFYSQWSLHGTVTSVVPASASNPPINFTEMSCGLPPGTGTTSSTYRIDAGGCIECLPPNQNHPMCTYTEPTCGGTTGTTTGTTGGPMKPTISFCSGGTFTPHYPMTLNGSDLTQADVNKTIMGNYSTPNGNPNSGQFGQFDSFHGTITSIIPSTVGGGVDTSEVPCGLPPGTGTTTSTCNKSCQQLASNFKKKAQGKGCNWLNNRLNAFLQKLPTTTPGSCKGKRISCKIRVVKALIKQKGC